MLQQAPNEKRSLKNEYYKCTGAIAKYIPENKESESIGRWKIKLFRQVYNKNCIKQEKMKMKLSLDEKQIIRRICL